MIMEKRTEEELEQRPENIDKIIGNEDILREVLVRVPAKSLIKFRCVSKSWLTLISDPKFCYNHSVLNPKVVLNIYYYVCRDLMSLSLHSNRHRSFPSLRFLRGEEYGTKACFEDSCNGLILCSSFPKENQYSVFNPTTQKSRIILNLAKTSNDYEFICLAFDPARSPYYKVVLIRRPIDFGSNEVHIYSSETSSWRHVNIMSGSYPSRKKAYWDGAIHWLSRGRHIEFDVDREILKQTQFCKKLEERHCIGKCHGNLVLILYTPHNLGDESVRIFEMNPGTRHWVIKQCVNLGEVLDIESDLEGPKFHVLSVVEGLIKNDMVLVLVTAIKFYAYNLRTKVLLVLCEPSETRLRYLHHGYAYSSLPCCQLSESLYPV